MKRLLCALGVAALALPAAHASPRTTVPGLVYTPGYGNSILTSYEPTTLVRSGSRLRLVTRLRFASGGGAARAVTSAVDDSRG